MPKPGGFHKKSSWTGEVKPVVLKLGPHYMSNDRFCWANVIPPIFYQNIKKIHSKHLRPRVAFLLTSKMMGHVFSHHFQELAIWWGAKPPFSIVGAIKNQLFFYLVLGINGGNWQFHSMCAPPLSLL